MYYYCLEDFVSLWVHIEKLFL